MCRISVYVCEKMGGRNGGTNGSVWRKKSKREKRKKGTQQRTGARVDEDALHEVQRLLREALLPPHDLQHLVGCVRVYMYK